MDWYLHLLAFDKLFMLLLIVALLGTYFWQNRKHGKGNW